MRCEPAFGSFGPSRCPDSWQADHSLCQAFPCHPVPSWHRSSPSPGNSLQTSLPPARASSGPALAGYEGGGLNARKYPCLCSSHAEAGPMPIVFSSSWQPWALLGWMDHSALGPGTWNLATSKCAARERQPVAQLPGLWPQLCHLGHSKNYSSTQDPWTGKWRGHSQPGVPSLLQGQHLPLSPQGSCRPLQCALRQALELDDHITPSLNVLLPEVGVRGE